MVICTEEIRKGNDMGKATASRLTNDLEQVRVVRQFDGHVRLHCEAFAAGHDRLPRFLKKVFSCDAVQSVTVSPISTTVLIRYNGNGRCSTQILAQFTTGGRKTTSKTARPSVPSYLPALTLLRRKVTFTRHPKGVTAWKVVHSSSGRLRLTHPLLCANSEYCAHAEKALLRLPQVHSVKASAATGAVLVLYGCDLRADQIITVLDSELESITREESKPNQGPKTGLALSSSALALTTVSHLWMPWALPFSAALTFGAGYPVFKKACHAIAVKKKIKVDILDSIVVISCLAAGQHGIAAFMVWILDVADALLDKTCNTSRRLLSELFGKQPRFATVVVDAKETKTPLDDIRRGDMVAVYAGEQIPVDGTVVSGDAMVDQHTLTGESAPVEKTNGDRAFASTVILAGQILMSVEESADNTSAAKIARIITESGNYQSKVQSTGERIADKMVLPTLGLASVGWATGGQNMALAIINADYGTGIRVAAPMGLLACLARACRSGIIVKKGSALERLSSVDTFIFEKTGTLTREMPEVASVRSFEKGVSEEQVFWYTATAEQRFSHPIARAILEHATELELSLPSRDALKYHVGFGIEVNVNGDSVKVGSARFMEREGIHVPMDVVSYITEVSKKGGSVVLLGRNGRLSGAVELESSQRPEAYDLIQRLQKDSAKKVILLSGDNEAATKTVAGQLGIQEYCAQMLPQEKAEYVKRLQRRGRVVAMTGDGINDGIALSLADVSISLRGGSDVATDVADVVFMDGTLGQFETLIDVADMFNRNVRRSFGLVAVSNTVCIVGALGGVIGLSASVLLNNGVNLLALMYGMKPLFCEMEDANGQELL